LRSSQGGVAQRLTLKPADQVPGQEDQLLVEGNARLTARGQVTTRKDPLALLDPRFDDLAPIGEHAHPPGGPGVRRQTRGDQRRRPPLRARRSPPVLAGKQAQRVGAPPDRGPPARGDEPVLADLLPAQTVLAAQARRDPITLGARHYLVA